MLNGRLILWEVNQLVQKNWFFQKDGAPDFRLYFHTYYIIIKFIE